MVLQVTLLDLWRNFKYFSTGSAIFAGSFLFEITLIFRIFENKGSALSIQFVVSSIKNEVERHDTLKLKRLQEDFKILEMQEISVAVFKGKKILYSTPKVDVRKITREVAFRRISNSAMIWDDGGFALCYLAKRSGAVIMAVGKIPFTERKARSKLPLKEILEIGDTVVLAVAVTFKSEVVNVQISICAVRNYL